MIRTKHAAGKAKRRLQVAKPVNGNPGETVRSATKPCEALRTRTNPYEPQRTSTNLNEPQRTSTNPNEAKRTQMNAAPTAQTQVQGPVQPQLTGLAGLLARDRPLVMGIVNVTDDSFSGDGVLNPDNPADADAAVARAKAQIEAGAD